jgi:hypothetical protein
MGAVALLEKPHCETPEETLPDGGEDQVLIKGPTGQVWPPQAAASMAAGQEAQLNTHVLIDGGFDRPPPDGE